MTTATMTTATMNLARNLASNGASQCPGCGQESIRSRGRLPDVDYFAGRQLDPPLSGGSLYACNQCGLNFRYPRLSKSEADAFDSQGEDENWASPAEKRPDWQMARRWISELDPGKSVLDIACFDGRFLKILDDHHDRYGIEIHPGASERARRAGVDIVASDFAELSQVERKFSVITAFDILEHVHSPHEFLACVAESYLPTSVAFAPWTTIRT